MKYLYKILRLFKCPHKYVSVSVNRIKCKYCGKIKNIKCNHEYKKIREFNVLRNEEPFGYEYVLECKNCGRIIGEKVYVA